MSLFLQKNRKLILLWIFFISFLIVFFVGKKTDSDTGKSYFTLTSNGVSYFRKGLDVSWWVRFSYKADFAEYKQLYSNVTEYNQVRKRILDIILKNIDSRISALGVSDYNSFVQYINGEDYVIVEIWWLKDIEEAKKTIWKTVELEFKLANEQEPTPELLAKRRSLADNFLVSVTKNPQQFQSLTEGRGSDDVYYNNYSQVTLSELPAIYAKNLTVLQNLSSGQVLDRVLAWLYHQVSSVDASGATVTENLEGYLVVKSLWVTKKSVTTLSKERFKNAALAQNLTVRDASQSQQSSIKVWEYLYNPSARSLTYNNGLIFSGQQAYNVQLYKIQKPQMIGKNQSEIAQDLALAEQKALEMKASLEKNVSVDSSLNVVQWWQDEQTILGYIGADKKLSVGVNLFDQFDGYYVLKISAAKAADQKLYDIAVIDAVSQPQYVKFQDAIQFETLYSFEEVFVRNKNSWVSAKDSATSEILNGAFFKFASINQSQLGRPVVEISFNDKGKEIFCNITAENIGKQMAIFVWWNLQTAPKINDKICWWTAQIEWGFTVETAKELITSLNEWAMPVKLIVANEEKISPSLWEYAIQWALIAGAVGFVLIFFMLWLMYGLKKALVGLFTLLIFVIVLFAVVKITDYALSLSGIAAIILTLGMAVDANILIFERVLEEKQSGKTFSQAIDLGYQRSWSAIRDGNLSSGLIAFLLFSMGTNVFKGFGAMMLVNMFMILLLNVPVTVELLHFFFTDKGKK